MLYNKLHNLWINLLITFSLVIVSAGSLSAIESEYIFRWQAGDGTLTEDFDAGIGTSMEIRYDVISQMFYFEVNLLPPAVSERFAKSFVLIVSDGPYPTQYGAEYAAFYFDALDLNNPILTVYPYNAYDGGNDSESFKDARWHQAGIQTPDNLCTSLQPSCGDWIKELSVTEELDGSRTFKFNVDASTINSANLTWPNTEGFPWKGAQFQDLIGVWFIPYGDPDTSITYGADGYIDEFFTGDPGGDYVMGFLDGSLIPTVRDPLCDLGQEGMYENLVCEGAETMITLDASNSFGPNGAELSYNWSTTCPNVSLEDAAAESTKMTLFDPGLELAVDCKVSLTITADNYSEVCELPVSVEPCNYECTERDFTETFLEMDSNAHAQARIVKKLAKRYVRQAKGTSQEKKAKRFKKKTVSLVNELFNESWFVTWESVPQVILTCENTLLCFETSFEATLEQYDANSDQFVVLTKQVARRIKRLTGKKSNKAIKRSTKLNEDSKLLSSTVPTSFSQCI